MKYFFFLFSTFFLATCTPDDDLTPRPDETPLEALNRLVPITQTGAGTFGCLVNGELWIPEVDGASDVAADALLSSNDLLQILVRKEPLSDVRNQSFSLISRIEINSETSVAASSTFRDRNVAGECRSISNDTTMISFISVENLDRTSYIVSGRFKCTYQEPDCPDTKIEITDGRFDLRYRF